MRKQAKVLFIHSTRSAVWSLETRPVAFNAVKMLAASQNRLTVCLWETRSAAYEFLERDDNVAIHYFSDTPVFALAIFSWLWALRIGILLRNRFDYIFAVG